MGLGQRSSQPYQGTERGSVCVRGGLEYLPVKFVGKHKMLVLSDHLSEYNDSTAQSMQGLVLLFFLLHSKVSSPVMKGMQAVNTFTVTIIERTLRFVGADIICRVP